MQFKFLTVGEHTVAATFGLLWNRQFYSLHISHDNDYAEYSPGVLLTALELEAAFKRGDCDRFDFLGGFLANKDNWATTITPTVALYANRPSLRGRLFQWTFFTAKPALRRLLVRFGILDAMIRIKKKLIGGSRL
jgi:CelD/BcsL family acetyltransferase involved in cellulose biosynthesis